MVAIYARQSIEKKDSLSIENQIALARREARTDDIKIYQDSGFSGKNTNRPAFTQMMQDIQNGLIDQVIVYRLDRISRSILDFADFINELEAKKVSFISATEKFDTSTPMGRAMLYIVVVFAQLERETIGERVRDNYYARIKNGAWGGGPAAYGFDLVRTQINGKACTTYQANEHIEVVKKIFDLYAQPGTTLRSIQNQLNAEGVRTKNGRYFSSIKISDILKNPSYVQADQSIYNYYQSKGCIMGAKPEAFDGIHGCILVGKRDASTRKYHDISNHTIAIGKQEGVVDSSTFLFCQSKLSQNMQIKNTNKGKYSWLTGLVKCGLCGYSMNIRSWDSKKLNRKKHVFACSGHYNMGCCPVYFSRDVGEVEDYVTNEMLSEVQKYQLKSNQQEQETQKKCNEFQVKIADIDGKIENLIASLEQIGNVSAEYINRRIEMLHAEKMKLFDAYNMLVSERKSLPITPFTASDWYEMDLADKRMIAVSIIDKVLISPNDIQVLFK